CDLLDDHSYSLLFVSSLHDALPISPAFLGFYTLEYDGNITHASTHKSELTGGCRCCSFTDDDIFFFAMGFLPGIVVVIMDFECRDRKSTRLNSSHVSISYAVFCLKK